MNENFLEAFIYARKKPTQGAIASAVGVGAGILALDAAVATTSFVPVMPVAGWGVAGFVGFVLTGGAPLVPAPAYCQFGYYRALGWLWHQEGPRHQEIQ